jgi:hypothetical protein
MNSPVEDARLLTATDQPPPLREDLQEGLAWGTDMSSNERGFIRRLLSRVADLLPDGGIGRDGPAPDIDGRRDTDADYRRAVLRTKSQMSSGGQATTSYEPVDRGSLND